MKKSLHKFYACLVAFVAMFAMSTTAMAEVVTIQFASHPEFDNWIGAPVYGYQLTQDGVTVRGARDNDGQGTYAYIYGTYTTLTVSAEKSITKIEFEGDFNTGKTFAASTGTVNETGTEWTGDATSVVFSSPDEERHEFYTITVTLSEGGGDPSTEPEISGYATMTTVSPESEISLDERPDGMHYFTVNFEEQVVANFGTYSGNVLPAACTFTDDKGNNYEIENLQAWAPSNGQVYRNIAFNTKQSITEPGVYTFHFPEGVVKFEGNKVNPELNLTWTLKAAEKFEFGWNDVEAQGTKADGAYAFQALTGFVLSAPQGVTFNHLADGVKIQTREVGGEEEEDKYVDVEGATVELKDGAVVVTFAEPITTQGYVNYILPEGSVFATNGTYNKACNLSANVDPYTYFELDFGNELYQGLEFVAPFNSLNITLPAGIEVKEVGETISASYWNEGNVAVPLTVTGFEQKGQTLVVSFTGGDAIPVDQNFNLETATGFVKSTNEFCVSSSARLNNNVIKAAGESVGINSVIAADSAKVYDLAGRRVKAQKGVNIVNGKVVIK